MQKKIQQQKKKDKGSGQQNQKKKPKEKDLNYDMCDFPIPYSCPELATNWFDFNDSTVRPIMPGTLQTMFGGTSANAYMLIYRQRKISRGEGLKKP